jgi:hypothetical protein
MCNCLKEIEEKCQQQIKESVTKNYTVSEWRDKGTFLHKGIGLKKNDKGISVAGTVLSLPVVAKYVRQRVNGEPEKRETSITMTVLPTFCPFCGVKIEQ